LADVLLDCGLGNPDAEFHEFAADAFPSPETVLPGHLLDQGDGFACYPWAPAPEVRFELPEQAEALAMPAQESVRFEDEEGCLPTPDTTCKEDEPEAIGLGEAWFIDLAMEDDELLPEEGILSDEFGSRAHDIRRNGENQGMAAGQGKVEEILFQGIEYGLNETN